MAAGCGTAREAPQPSATVRATAAPSTAASPAVTTAPSSTTPFAAPSRTGRSVRTSTGWEITVYYTAVERFHDGRPTRVTGCPRLECSRGDDDLGSYPGDFVDAVREEGTGRTASGRYLNWSYDVGFWLDSAPRTSSGDVLEPFVSAAADPDVLPQGTRFAIADCGRQEDGSAPATAVCAVLRRAAWRITDEFTPGLGGPRHIDIYIGPETGPDFTDSEWYIALAGAKLAITR